ncbi:MsnO8 family LLM class oxidoreductase [Mucilaginibacter sp. BT774]|uniref:MsnO8 family LLM class oxidoreductase n=1 Tax=Mucilaginibacter sp. BT774 TaxID=3062276 RepID=UPI00267544A9|nr:MsnO8 family LLM class oxidoreductase [Mucilaginibacter sp. BT774]MDO3627166.1 MsnO8 family LLM class oxidoreductase [Mucilaginibacter sp. BT774]
MKLSILELSLVKKDQTRSQALANSIELAMYVETLGYYRMWVAEHHNTPYIAGRAPEVLIAAIASATTSIRVGSGAVLLNHYSPYKIAEVFCTLNELFPGRIDLGVGRAFNRPAIDFALQQTRKKITKGNYKEQIDELLCWLGDDFPGEHPFASIGLHAGQSHPELFVLGSSSGSAKMAGKKGVRYAYAGFLNHPETAYAVDSYKNSFKRSSDPYGIMPVVPIVCLQVVCADTEAEVRRQLCPSYLLNHNLSAGKFSEPFLSPDEAFRHLGYLPEIEYYERGSRILPRIIAGTQGQVTEQLSALSLDLGVEEFMIQDVITDLAARRRSLELMAPLCLSSPVNQGTY